MKSLARFGCRLDSESFCEQASVSPYYVRLEAFQHPTHHWTSPSDWRTSNVEL
jgi:hypothetical protein